MRFFRTAALTSAALLATVAFAACGDDDSDDTNTPVPTATSPATPPEGTATRPPTQGTEPAPTDTPGGGGAAPLCGADDLHLSVLPAGGAAGTHFVALSVTNASGADCAMVGYPGLSLTDAAGNILGEPADRNPAVDAETIVLAPGEAAHAMAGLPNHQNFPPGACEGPSVNLVMYPPEDTESITVPFEDYACEGFSVRVFEPGANEPGR